MRRPTTLIALLAAVLMLAPLSATATASTTDQIYTDCEFSPTGFLTGHYSRAALQQALNNPPADVSEYSGCSDAISKALRDLSQRQQSGGGPSTPSGGGSGGGGSTFGGGGTGSAGGGSTEPSAPAHVGTKAPVKLAAGMPVAPGTIPAIGRDGHRLPTPLLVLLVLLGAGALASVTATIGRRVIAHRRA